MIQRAYLKQRLQSHLEQISKAPVNTTPDGKEAGAYELGKALGYQDGIKAVLKFIDQLPSEPPIHPWSS